MTGIPEPTPNCDRKYCSYPATDGMFCDVHAEEQRFLEGLVEGVLLKNAGMDGIVTTDRIRRAKS